MPELKGGFGKDGEMPRSRVKRLRERPVSYVVRAMLRMIARNGEGWAEDRIMQAIAGDPWPVWGEALAWAIALETHKERIRLEAMCDELADGCEPHNVATMLMALQMQTEIGAKVVAWDKRRKEAP